MIVERIPLPAKVPGMSAELTVLRFGQPGARPRAYIQSALHADEIPGMLAAHALRRRLEALDAESAICGEIVLVPVANPIGLAQRLFGAAEGRFDFADGQNFNRGFPALTEAAAHAIANRLGPEADENVAIIRAALRAALAALPKPTPTLVLKHTLLGLALDADLVLDLHCDGEAAMHLYTHDATASFFAPLAASLGAEAILTASVSGGDPFDEAVSRPWAELAARFPNRPIPFACPSTTVELRGQRDVTHDFAEADAEAILDFFILRGVVSGPAPAIPVARSAPTPLESSEALEAGAPGILVYRRETGDRVAKGEIIADIIDPLSGATHSIVPTTDGVFFARAMTRFVVAGQRVGKVAGTELKRRGALLSP